MFRCSNCRCPHHVNCYLNTKDAGLTSNLWCHAQKCWGKDILAAVEALLDQDIVHEDVVKSVLVMGSITLHFERKKRTVTYWNHPHTHAEMHTEIMKWVTESMCPFSIVKDPGFQVLMNMGQLSYWIPTPTTIAHDVKVIFAQMHSCIAKILQVSNCQHN